MLVNILFPINAEAFTYLVPEKLEAKIKAGVRVLAPFKKARKIGIVLGIGENASVSLRGVPIIGTTKQSHRVQEIATHPAGVRNDKKDIPLKTIEEVLDEEPLIPENLLKLIQWAGQYYLSSAGLALKNAVPQGILDGRKSGKVRITYDADVTPEKTFALTHEQKKALAEINSVQSGAFLLHGVTGSGKTEIYIRAIEFLPADKQAIVLVPEIALTAQFIDRFRSRFNKEVAFFHSGITPGEKLAEWRKMKNGEVRIAIGVRSAVFAPFQNLGLIVVDEEQETSYKQFEGFKYNARDTALARAKLEGIKIILGSATPSMESFFNAKKGKFKYLELKSRVDEKPMPLVEIIDMTKEDKMTWIFSDKLLNAMKNNASAGHQSLIMLNRRGYSPFLMCTDCGHTYKCPACSITLTYHKDTKTLNCHYCGAHLIPPAVCPECKGTKTKHVGLGTQKVEEELNSLIPEISLKRMDRDTTRKKLSHYRIVKDMESKKLDVLLGTQMVAKGHDFPGVTLSAVVFADIALNLPDFRSSERAFQLFTQLAGRAGRGDFAGSVYIQTYEPHHYIFDYVKNHDYQGFYEKEIEFRKELSYPPLGRLLRIVFSFRSKEGAAKTMKNVTVKIKKISRNVIVKSEAMKQSDMKSIEILGPAPAPVEKIRNRWRWHLILKGSASRPLRQRALEILDAVKDIKDMKTDIDVDPVNLM